MIFEKILGNESNKIFLNNILKHNTVSHSYMFIGENSIGKKLFAKEFAKGILCESDTSKPCGNCTSCIKFENSNHPDFYILDEEDGTIKNEQIREINKNILEKPIESLKKVYIINNSENMTVQAQNSLLKTLEEPPEHAVIILITSNENKMLTTIKSRCTKINFIPLNNSDIRTILRREYNIDNVSEFIFTFARGSVERTLKIQAKLDLYGDIQETFNDIKNIDALELLKLKEELAQNKEDIDFILEYINAILKDLSMNDSKYLNCIFIVEQTKDRLKRNNNFDMTIDNLLLKIWEEING